MTTNSPFKHKGSGDPARRSTKMSLLDTFVYRRQTIANEVEAIHPFLLQHWASVTDSMSDGDLGASVSFDSPSRRQSISPDQTRQKSIFLDPKVVDVSRALMRRFSENQSATESFKQEVGRYMSIFESEKTLDDREGSEIFCPYPAATTTPSTNANKETTIQLAATTTTTAGKTSLSNNVPEQYIKVENTILEDSKLTEDMLESIPKGEDGNPTSIGSIKHFTGDCRPCVFHNNPKKTGCFNGLKCDYCHFSHPDKKKPPRPSKHQRLFRKTMMGKHESEYQPPQFELGRVFGSETYDYPMYRIGPNGVGKIEKNGFRGGTDLSGVQSLLSYMQGTQHQIPVTAADQRAGYRELRRPIHQNGHFSSNNNNNNNEMTQMSSIMETINKQYINPSFMSTPLFPINAVLDSGQQIFSPVLYVLGGAQHHQGQPLYVTSPMTRPNFEQKVYVDQSSDKGPISFMPPSPPEGFSVSPHQTPNIDKLSLDRLSQIEKNKVQKTDDDFITVKRKGGKKK